jgi:hypothetical protein
MLKKYDLVVFYPGPCDPDGYSDGHGTRACVLDIRPDGEADLCLVDYTCAQHVRMNIKPADQVYDLAYSEYYQIEPSLKVQFDMDKDF